MKASNQMLEEIRDGTTPVSQVYFYSGYLVQTGKVLAVPEDEESVLSIEYTVDGQETDEVEFDENSRNIDVGITINWADGTETQITMMIEYTWKGT